MVYHAIFRIRGRILGNSIQAWLLHKTNPQTRSHRLSTPHQNKLRRVPLPLAALVDQLHWLISFTRSHALPSGTALSRSVRYQWPVSPYRGLVGIPCWVCSTEMEICRAWSELIAANPTVPSVLCISTCWNAEPWLGQAQESSWILGGVNGMEDRHH